MAAESIQEQDVVELVRSVPEDIPLFRGNGE